MMKLNYGTGEVTGAAPVTRPQKLDYALDMLERHHPSSLACRVPYGGGSPLIADCACWVARLWRDIKP